MKEEATKRGISAFRWIVFLLLIAAPHLSDAQKPVVFPDDSLGITEENSGIRPINDSIRIPTDGRTTYRTPSSFKPNPKTAWKVALLFPGLGQYYNQQYWKLPIVYGGLMGCAYAITWNNKTFQDYKEAYFSIMADAKADPDGLFPEEWSDRWQIFVQAGLDPKTRLHDASFHNSLKRGKDFYRRYRDLSIIITAAIYLIAVADAYVDAQMFDFDVSPDLSFQFAPAFMPETAYHPHCYGIHIRLNF